VENILNHLSKKLKINFLFYVLALILCKENKTCKTMGRFLKKLFGVSHDRLYGILSKSSTLLKLFPKLMVTIAQHFSKQKKGSLSIDDTSILKPYSEKLPGVWAIFDVVLGRTERGLKKVAAAWGNGDVTIPLEFKWYFYKAVVGENYKSKSQIAISIIKFCLKNNIKFQYVVFDAHYSTIEMIKFLQRMRIRFVAKIPCNRKIHCTGIFEQLKKHPSLKLFRNERSKRIEASYHDMKLYFSVHKRKDKSGEYNYMYIVSNIDLIAKNYIKIYDERWDIEETFRTIKQLLGLNQCAARSLEKQEAHIYFIFFTYSFLQYEKNKNSLKNPESAGRFLGDFQPEEAMSRITSFSETVCCFA